MSIQLIPIRRLVTPAKGRPEDAKIIKSLQESISMHGLLQPIIVKPSTVIDGLAVDGFRLVAGRHRLAAVKALGWAEVPAHVLDDGVLAVQCDLIEIDENLCRSELTAPQKALALKKRKLLWESLKEHGVESGGTSCPTRIVGYKQPPEATKGFAAETAAATGLDKRTINRYIRVIETLGNDLESLEDTPITLADMARLAELPETDRRQEIVALTAPSANDEHRRPAEKASAMDEHEQLMKLRDRVFSGFLKLPQPMRASLLTALLSAVEQQQGEAA